VSVIRDGKDCSYPTGHAQQLKCGLNNSAVARVNTNLWSLKEYQTILNFKKLAKFGRAVGMWMTYKSWSLPAELLNHQVGKKRVTYKLEQQNTAFNCMFFQNFSVETVIFLISGDDLWFCVISQRSDKIWPLSDKLNSCCQPK